MAYEPPGGLARMCAIDNNESVILILLDLSAAFGTVDHLMQLSRLRDRIRVNGTAVAWFESYLTSPTQFVRVNDCRSTQRSLEPYRVSQVTVSFIR